MHRIRECCSLHGKKNCITCRNGENRAVRYLVSVAKYTVLSTFVFIGKLLKYFYLFIRDILRMNHPVYFQSRSNIHINYNKNFTKLFKSTGLSQEVKFRLPCLILRDTIKRSVTFMLLIILLLCYPEDGNIIFLRNISV
jgi:hypothetical protein